MKFLFSSQHFQPVARDVDGDIELIPSVDKARQKQVIITHASAERRPQSECRVMKNYLLNALRLIALPVATASYASESSEFDVFMHSS